MFADENNVCLCFNISKEVIVEAIRTKGLKTLEEVMEATQAGMGCGGCHAEIEDILKEVNG